LTTFSDSEVGVPSLIASDRRCHPQNRRRQWGVLAIIGGAVLGVGIFIIGLLRDRQIDYDIRTRLDKLEK